MAKKNASELEDDLLAQIDLHNEMFPDEGPIGESRPWQDFDKVVRGMVRLFGGQTKDQARNLIALIVEKQLVVQGYRKRGVIDPSIEGSLKEKSKFILESEPTVIDPGVFQKLNDPEYNDHVNLNTSKNIMRIDEAIFVGVELALDKVADALDVTVEKLNRNIHLKKGLQDEYARFWLVLLRNVKDGNIISRRQIIAIADEHMNPDTREKDARTTKKVIDLACEALKLEI